MSFAIDFPHYPYLPVDEEDEGLSAFCPQTSHQPPAQLRFPYPAGWMKIVAARTQQCNPSTTGAVHDSSFIIMFIISGISISIRLLATGVYKNGALINWCFYFWSGRG